MSNEITWDYCMTVGQLREQLEQLPEELIIVMSKDAEGNGYSPLSSVERALYSAESNWSGEVHDEEDPEDVDLWPDTVRCIVLGPVN